MGSMGRRYRRPAAPALMWLAHSGQCPTLSWSTAAPGTWGDVRAALRELGHALAMLAADTTLVLVLEDLHWSDSPTVDALTYLGHQLEPARLLVLGTYRPVDAMLRAHPLRRTVQELCGRGRPWSCTSSSSSPRMSRPMWLGAMAGRSRPPWRRSSISVRMAMRCSW